MFFFSFPSKAAEHSAFRGSLPVWKAQNTVPFFPPGGRRTLSFSSEGEELCLLPLLWRAQHCVFLSSLEGAELPFLLECAELCLSTSGTTVKGEKIRFSLWCLYFPLQKRAADLFRRTQNLFHVLWEGARAPEPLFISFSLEGGRTLFFSLFLEERQNFVLFSL